jgi:hypothetical protein
MFLYRRGIFIIDMYILYSSNDLRFTPGTQCFEDHCLSFCHFSCTPLYCKQEKQRAYIRSPSQKRLRLRIPEREEHSMFLYRRGIFIIDRYILYSSNDLRFTARTQCFCTDVVYLLLTGTFCIRLITFVSPCPILIIYVQCFEDHCLSFCHFSCTPLYCKQENQRAYIRSPSQTRLRLRIPEREEPY